MFAPYQRGERFDMVDEFTAHYSQVLDGIYDCVDRIVLNAYFQMGQSPGGFRTWWRSLYGSDDNLDNAHLMRMAGRLSRRVRAYAQAHQIPLIDCARGERKHKTAEPYIPQEPRRLGVFLILVGRAPAVVWDIERSKNGTLMNIARKTPLPYVNHYSFHIMDPQWGHVVIKLCGHPPFGAQIILNGHEYVACQADKKGIGFTKDGNCFTNMTSAADLARVAETMRAPSSVGRLVQVCERWIYSACLCFALDLAEQQRSGFHYSYAVFQTEYSRNLLFRLGHTMDQVFQGIIDRCRAPLNIKTLKTVFGYKHRPKYSKKTKSPRFQVVVERPVYDLTIFRVHFGKLTLKIYSKGERVLRIEVIADNTTQLRCGRSIEKFPRITYELKSILERFLCVLHSVDVSFIDLGTLDTWPLPTKVGSTRIGGLDVNRPRVRAVMEAVVALSPNPWGFTASDLTVKVREILKTPGIHYTPRQASYDLKRLRGKNLVRKVPRTHRYEIIPEGLKAMAAFLVLMEKAIKPLLAAACQPKANRTLEPHSPIDVHYRAIHTHMADLFQIIGIAA